MRALLWLAWFGCGVIAAQGCNSDGGGDPGPSPQECSDACARIAAADCGDIGSECFDACVRQGTVQRDECQAPFDSYEACFFAAPLFSCEDGRTQPAGCDNERAALHTCAGDTNGVGGNANGGAGGNASGNAGGAT